jgi:S1-C subfamily serine protease
MRASPAIILLAFLLLLIGAAACGGGDDDGDDDEEQPTATAEGEAVGNEDLAHAVVQIFALDPDGETVWTGSGTFVSEDGLIVTNAHVVDDRFGEYEELGVAPTVVTDEPPELTYRAEISAVDYSLDLAVIEVTETLDGDDPSETFPFIETGDSNNVGIGDDIRIFGYPGIGGETITFTEGAVSGFTSERSVGNRAWIKTDATIAGGNSGGLAVNEDGQIIGVPTIAGSGSEASSVDCRVIEDTNGDGFLDENDTCVPVGGFINGLRPINLASDLIDAARTGETYVSPYYEEEEIEETPGGGFDVGGVELSNLVFSPDVDSNQPSDIVVLLPSGSQKVCGFWDYDGMEEGMGWDAIWYVDGVQNENGSILEDTWVGGSSGNWWVCIVDEEFGLTDGLYELVLQVEGEPQGSEAIYVGDDHEIVQFELDNQSSVDICAAWVSPSEASNWGFEDLGADVTLPAGDTVTLEVATGTYDILLQDCDFEDLLEDRGLEITQDDVYPITDQ